MNTLHIAPGDSAAGSLRQALHGAMRDDRVIAFSDDLSCGPIAQDDPAVRAAWWGKWMDWPELENHYRSFWEKVDASQDRLVVWFGRHSAREFAFRLAWAFRMGTRPYHFIDVTGLRFPIRRPDGSEKMSDPAKAVSIMNPSQLAAQFDAEQPAALEKELKHSQDWERLKKENAPFRVVTPAGLASAPITYFDELLLAHASPEWRKMAYVVGHAMAASFDPYYQVGDLALHQRVVALIEAGKLAAEGDPYDMRLCRVKWT